MVTRISRVILINFLPLRKRGRKGDLKSFSISLYEREKYLLHSRSGEFKRGAAPLRKSPLPSPLRERVRERVNYYFIYLPIMGARSFLTCSGMSSREVIMAF
jgi:hypothetical protein